MGRRRNKPNRSTITIIQHTKALPSLVPGEKVTVEDPRTHEWETAVIQNKIKGIPRLDIVSTPSDRELRHNRSQIRRPPLKSLVAEEDRLSSTSGAAKANSGALRADQFVNSNTGSLVVNPSLQGRQQADSM